MSGEPVGGGPVERAGFLLSRVGTTVQAGFKEIIAGWGLRPLHYLVLGALGAGAGPEQRDLCRRLGVDSGNMVELLDALEELGYARRARDPADRRRHVVTITPDGRSALAEMKRAVDAFDRQFLAPLDESERRGLVASWGSSTRPRPRAEAAASSSTRPTRSSRDQSGRRPTATSQPPPGPEAAF